MTRAVAAAAVAAAAVAAAGCGARSAAGFCGLARTANGFDPVAAVHGIGCPGARAAIVAVEAGDRRRWSCSRAMHAAWELDCRARGAEVRVLERTPVRARRAGDVVVLANWAFRLRAGAVEGRTAAGAWQVLAHAPFCVPDVPREALQALRLRPLTRNGGCFGVAPR